MPRYYFHVQDVQDSPDTEGTVFPNAEAARLAAVVASAEALRSHAEDFWSHRNWRMHVTDTEGLTICQLRFSGTLGPSATT